MDKKNITIASLIILLTLVGGYNLEDVLSGDVVLYECESRDILPMECDGFSKYVHPEGKCLNEELGNRICKTGWVQLVPKDETESSKEIETKQTGNQWLCSVNGCVAIE